MKRVVIKKGDAAVAKPGGEDLGIPLQAIRNIEALKRAYPESFEAYRGVSDDELADTDVEYLKEARATARKEMKRNVEVMIDLRERLKRIEGKERDTLRAIRGICDVAAMEIKGKDDDKMKYNVNMFVQVLTGGK